MGGLIAHEDCAGAADLSDSNMRTPERDTQHGKNSNAIAVAHAVVALDFYT